MPINELKYVTRDNCELRHAPVEECASQWRKVVRLKDHESNLGEFDVLFCAKCKLGFTQPYPSEETAGLLYETKKSGDFDVLQDSLIDVVKDYLASRLLRRLAPHGHVKAILDYATGNGRFALGAKKVFREAKVDAVDYQSDPPALLQSGSRGVNYYNVAEFATHKEQYDLIILRHVLEHTHHPVELVKELASRLAPSGILYIEVPNLNSGCARVFGKYWKAYYVPRHIYHYTNESLTEIAVLAGLKPEIGKNGMPLMGNTIAILTGAEKTNLFVQILGVVLNPLQMLIETLYGSSTCINARCRKMDPVSV